MNRYPFELAAAILFASNVHIGQTDKQGRPYILHPLHVMNEVIHLGDDFAIAAVCHDTVEDGVKHNLFKSEEAGYMEFSSRVGSCPSAYQALKLLTHKRGEDYGAYIARIRENVIATEVKKADLRHNSSLMRLKGITDADIARMRKYHAAYLYLTGQDDKLMSSFS